MTLDPSPQYLYARVKLRQNKAELRLSFQPFLISKMGRGDECQPCDLVRRIVSLKLKQKGATQ